MAKQAVARTVDSDPIDRLEDKVRLLVDVVTRLRADQARAVEENARLSQEIDMLRARLQDARDPTSSSMRSGRNVKWFASASPRCSRTSKRFSTRDERRETS